MVSTVHKFPGKQMLICLLKICIYGHTQQQLFFDDCTIVTAG